jgi:organic radical activating enzyme
MSSKLLLSCLAKIYITNVCNLTCYQCNRYNNFDFKGWQRWSDYADIYKKWGDRIEFTNHLTILGGEPLLNPDIVNWISGISDAFNVPIQIRTNGTRLDKIKGLYEVLRQAGANHGHKNYIAISLHDKNDFANIRKKICKFLQGNVSQKWHPDGHIDFIDSNNQLVRLQLIDEFVPASIQNPHPGKYTLYNNEPEKAHKACSFVKHKSYHFSKGKLYKCPPADLRTEFDLQHPLDISVDDRTLLNSYRPLTLDNFEQYASEFVASLDNAIPQCKFCPADNTPFKIYPIKEVANNLIEAI